MLSKGSHIALRRLLYLSFGREPLALKLQEALQLIAHVPIVGTQTGLAIFFAAGEAERLSPKALHHFSRNVLSKYHALPLINLAQIITDETINEICAVRLVEPEVHDIYPIQFAGELVGCLVLTLNSDTDLDNQTEERDRFLHAATSALTGVILLDEHQRELQSAKELAEAKNLAKNQAIASIQHELRTPLHAIVSYSEMIRDESDASKQVKEDAAKIHRSAKQLVDYINQSLDLAKIESGETAIHLTKVDIKELASRVTEDLSVLAKKRENQLHLHIDKELTIGQTDRQKLQQIITNLVSNAIKFTEQGEVVVRIEKASLDGQAAVAITVKDNGIGMSKEQVQEVFKPFKQVNQEKVNQTNAHHFMGTGLGLAIVKEYVELLNGTLEVSSKLGEGTSFQVILPLVQVV